MARGKSGGAKRGPKPKATKADLEAVAKLLSTQLRAVKKLVRQIHAEVVPNSTEGAPEPEPVETEPILPVEASTPAASATAVTNGVPVPLPVEAEITVAEAE